MLIVGLGNPGPNYEKTRHNIGFMVVDELINRFSANKLSSSSFNGELFKFSNHFLLKPLTFMNLSGTSVAAVKKFYKIDEVIVIHDDLDLPFGTLRFKYGGGHGGHPPRGRLGGGRYARQRHLGRQHGRHRRGRDRCTARGICPAAQLSQPVQSGDDDSLQSREDPESPRGNL